MLYDPTKNRIAQLRIAKGIMSRAELAREIKRAFDVDMTPITIARFEKGDARPRLDLAYALARYFDVSIEYLMGMSDDAHGDGRRRMNDERREDTPPEIQMAMETLRKQLMAVMKNRKENSVPPSQTQF